MLHNFCEFSEKQNSDERLSLTFYGKFIALSLKQFYKFDFYLT